MIGCGEPYVDTNGRADPRPRCPRYAYAGRAQRRELTWKEVATGRSLELGSSAPRPVAPALTLVRGAAERVPVSANAGPKKQGGPRAQSAEADGPFLSRAPTPTIGLYGEISPSRSALCVSGALPLGNSQPSAAFATSSR
jgi:hypothetical protein